MSATHIRGIGKLRLQMLAEAASKEFVAPEHFSFGSARNRLPLLIKNELVCWGSSAAGHDWSRLYVTEKGKAYIKSQLGHGN